MNTIIIVTKNNEFKEIYTDCPTAENELSVIVHEAGSPGAEEGLLKNGLFYKMSITGGFMEDVIYEEGSRLPFPSGNGLVLLKEQNFGATEIARLKQNMLAAFIEGYVSSYGELNRYILQMYRSENEEETKMAPVLNKQLKEFRFQQDTHYTALVDILNDGKFFDDAEDELNRKGE